MTDFAAEFARLAAEVAGFDAAAAARVEAELRRRHGGQQVRIAERAPVTLERIDAGLRARLPVAAIAVDLGVSRATIYRHLGRKKSQRQPGA